MTDSEKTLGQVFRSPMRLQPFWERQSSYAPEALAGQFAAKAVHPEKPEQLVRALSRLICDGQNAGTAYDILGSMRKHAGPMAIREVRVEFEYDYLSARRAASIPFYVLAPASTIESVVPEHTAGFHNPPLKQSDVGPLQQTIERMSLPEKRPAYNPVRSEFWIGDLCEKAIGLYNGSLPKNLAAGLFERESGAFVSTDKNLITLMWLVAEEIYPTPKAPSEENTVAVKAPVVKLAAHL